MKKYCIAEISVALALIISIVTSVIGFASDCKDVRENVVRLHILANSDSEEDQQIKLKVRDALLESGLNLFNGEMNADNAEEVLMKNKEYINSLVNKVLADNGFDYESEIYLTDEYFETRVYDTFTMPAGEYKALKIILGKGKGHNWWCVMFPPLCLPAAKDNMPVDAIFTKNGTEIISNSEKYEVKFKIIELIEEFKAYIKSK